MTFRFPVLLAQAIEGQAKATGRDRTTVVSEALTQTFGLSLPTKSLLTLELLQRQIEQLESSVQSLSQQLVTAQQVSVQQAAATETQVISAETQATCTDSHCQAFRQPLSEDSGRLQRDASALQTSLFERILARMPNPVFVCDRDQRLLYINPSGTRLLGLEGGNGLQQTIQAFALPQTIKTQLFTQLDAVFATGCSITNEIQFEAPLQGLRSYEYTLSPIESHCDQIEAVLCSTQEITERKQIEAALKVTEANYQNLFESTDDSILILDALTHCLLNANSNTSKRLGYTRQELSQLDVDAILPQWRSEIALTQLQALQIRDTTVFEHYLRHKNGTIIPVVVHSRLIEYDNQLAILSFIRDLSKPSLAT